MIPGEKEEEEEEELVLKREVAQRAVVDVPNRDPKHRRRGWNHRGPIADRTG